MATTRRPDPRPARTRAVILDAVHELVTEQGITDTTIAQVSDRAQVAVGSIYTHFGSKDGLVLELAWSRTAPAFATLEELRADRGPLERVTALGEAIVDFALAEPVSLGAFLGVQALPGDLASHEAGRQLLTEVELVSAHLRSDLQEAIDAGQTPEAPADELAAMLLGLWTGLAAAVVRGDRFAVDASLARRALGRIGTLLA
ncbi:MAG: TetR/AcrR family transcriptional regulator [Solirubrobacteraceae bacterium]|nr:TetR/AcrR family transcriptional regulator [Solirubrobacteraceae bacterium]